jgi:uncharacterized protein (TIGR02284 family)
MNKDSETIKVLNQFLQGEYMAVESFNNFISKVDDENIKVLFQNIQSQHRENINILAQHIQDVGGQPDENLGLKGKIADAMMDVKLKSEDVDMIIGKAIEGETLGINKAEKILRGNLDDKSRNIAGQILENDRQSIEKLNNIATFS